MKLISCKNLFRYYIYLFPLLNKALEERVASCLPEENKIIYLDQKCARLFESLHVEWEIFFCQLFSLSCRAFFFLFFC